MKTFNWKKLLPHIVAVLVFLLMTLVYFSPVLEGKDIKQDDAIGSMGWGKDAKKYHEESGEYSYWSNAMFSGMPCNYTYSPQPANTFREIGNLLTLNVFGASRRHIGCIFATFIGCYILFLALGCGPWLSIAGSVVYTLGSYNFIIISAGHMSKSLVIATMAPLIGGIVLCYRRKLLQGLLVTLIFAGLSIFWSHQQMSYYSAIVAAIMAVVYFVYAYREKWLPYYWKATAALAVVALLSVAPAVGILLPTADYAKESMRGGSELKAGGSNGSGGLDTDYAFMWSYGKMESLTLLVPNLYGSASGVVPGSELSKFLSRSGEELRYSVFEAAAKSVTNDYVNMLVQSNPGLRRSEAIDFIYNAPEAESLRQRIQDEAVGFAQSYEYRISSYWGEQPGTSGPVYVGAIVCFLFVLGMFIVRGPEKWWVLAAAIFSLVLAWGSNLSAVNNFLFEYMPLYNKFRAPSQALVVTTLVMCVLAILAVKRFMDITGQGTPLDKEALKRPLFVSAGVTAGICLLLALFGGSMFDFEAPGENVIALVPKLYDAIIDERKAMLVSDAWRSAGFIAATAALLFAYANVKGMKRGLFIGLLTVLFVLDMWPVCKRYVNDSHFIPKKETTEIKITDADKYIHSIEEDNHYRVLDYTRGSVFNQSFTSYYHNSIGGYSPAKLSRYQDLIEYQLGNNNRNVINMLNTKYFIKGKSAADVEPNTEAFGHCWLVDRIEWVGNAQEEMNAITNVDKSTAYIDSRWTSKVPDSEQYNNSTTGTIELVKRKNPGYLIYKSSCDAPKMAVFSEVYYKTWKAYVDGEEVTPVRANYVLRALPLQAGEHTIEFKCVDELMETTNSWSFYLSILVGAVLVVLAGAIIYNKVKSIEK